MKIPYLSRALAVGTISLLALSTPLFADDHSGGERQGERAERHHDRDDIDHREARRLVEQGELLPLSELLARHLDPRHDRLLDLETERDDGRLIYEMEILGQNGRVREIEVDAATGALLSQEEDD